MEKQSKTSLERPIVLFDGVCVLCNSVVDWLLRRDRQRILRFAPLQSEAGRDVLQRLHAGIVPRSVVFIEGETLTVKSEAVLRILRYLPAPWPLFSGLRWIPRSVRDAVYDLVARYRYRVFGKKNACRVPAGSEREQFLEHSDQMPQRSSKKR